jgi:hypothetical protein
MHKFGIELPKNVWDAYEIDRKMGTNFWCWAIEKEMKKIHEAMQEFDGTQEDAKKKLVGYQEIHCHMTFEVKMWVVNPCEFDIDKSVFPPSEQWKELYGDIMEDVPLIFWCHLVHQCILQHMLMWTMPAIE